MPLPDTEKKQIILPRTEFGHGSGGPGEKNGKGEHIYRLTNLEKDKK